MSNSKIIAALLIGLTLGCSGKSNPTTESATPKVASSSNDAKTTYMSFLDAAYRKDADAAISFYAEPQRSQLQANKQTIEPLFAMLPKDVRIINETQNGNEVVMQGEGTAFYGKAAGNIRMVQENGQWKILESKWNQAR